MNGYTFDTTVSQRLNNLVEQIPQEYQAQVFSHCMPEDGNIHDLERNLTSAVAWSVWMNWQEQERQAQEIARDTAWLGVTHIVNPATNGTIRTKSESKRLCRCGKFYPRTLTYCPICNPSQETKITSWKPQGFVSGSSDNHEYHSYTVDGE